MNARVESHCLRLSYYALFDFFGILDAMRIFFWYFMGILLYFLFSFFLHFFVFSGDYLFFAHIFLFFFSGRVTPSPSTFTYSVLTHFAFAIHKLIWFFSYFIIDFVLFFLKNIFYFNSIFFILILWAYHFLNIQDWRCIDPFGSMHHLPEPGRRFNEPQATDSSSK